MYPQGHPHQLEPILLKHFPMVLKAAAKIKARCETWNLWQSIIKIRRTHTLKIWIKGGDAVMVPVCSVCELIFKDILFLHCTTYMIQLHPIQYKLLNRPPPHPYPPLIKCCVKGWANKIIQQPYPMLKSLLPICHTAIHPSMILICGQSSVLETCLLKNDDHRFEHIQDLQS